MNVFVTCIVDFQPPKQFIKKIKICLKKSYIISLVSLRLKKEGSWYTHKLFKLEQAQKGQLFRKMSSYTNDKLYFQCSTFLKRGISTGCFKEYFWKHFIYPFKQLNLKLLSTFHLQTLPARFFGNLSLPVMLEYIFTHFLKEPRRQFQPSLVQNII